MNDFAEVNPIADSAFALPPDCVAGYVDHESQRNRLTSFFRFITVIPHLIWLALYGIVAGLAIIAAWFALVFTAQYPAGLYAFVVNFTRYYARVSAYMYLLTDKFPTFSGNADEPYAAHFLVGPPKERYSRPKVFFRGIIILPFAIIAQPIMTLLQTAAALVWVFILFTGREHAGLQGMLAYCYRYTVRFYAYAVLLTEAWPKFSDEEVNRQLHELGYQGTIPPSAAAPVATAAEVVPPAPPAPPAPPTPPAPPAPPAV